MARPENGLWEFLRARMPVGTHHSRIESQDTAPGFPDVHYTLKGCTGGMELKCQPFPTGEFPFAGPDKGLRKSQRMWIRDELAAGGRVIIVLQSRETIFFMNGEYFNEIDVMTLAQIAREADLIWEKDGLCSVPLLETLMTG